MVEECVCLPLSVFMCYLTCFYLDSDVWETRTSARVFFVYSPAAQNDPLDVFFPAGPVPSFSYGRSVFFVLFSQTCSTSNIEDLSITLWWVSGYEPGLTCR